MKNITRSLDIAKYLPNNKVLIIYGPRQVGKTTLIKHFLTTFSGKFQYYTGDDLDFAAALSKCSLDLMRKMFTGLSLLVIDEAQKIDNIGQAVKLIVDNIDDIQVIMTGSSSFDLANKTGETLTGRKQVLTMYPIAQTELLSVESQYEIEKKLPEYLVYGKYPAVLIADTYEQKEIKLRELVNSYLLKDILAFDLVRNSKVIYDLLKLLAFQIGSEVSLNELATNLEIDKNTVARYIDLLEKSFVIFSLGGFSRNLRKEVYKSQKYYFYDLGIRNALISNFNNLDTRDDVGNLWENFVIIERIKRNSYTNTSPNYYFWRTYDMQEIDFIEDINNHLWAYEFKWGRNRNSRNSAFEEAYKNATIKMVNKENYFEFIKF